MSSNLTPKCLFKSIKELSGANHFLPVVASVTLKFISLLKYAKQLWQRREWRVVQMLHICKFGEWRRTKDKDLILLTHFSYGNSKRTCSWKPCNYVWLLQWLADRLITESTGVERSQEGSRAAAQIVCSLVISHGAIWQHGHIQLSGLETVKHLQETKTYALRPIIHVFYNINV